MKKHEMGRIASKLLRIQMSEDLRALVAAIPGQDLTEIRGTPHVYRASGTFSFGLQKAKLNVMVEVGDGSVWAILEMQGVSTRLPFRTTEERGAAPRAAVEALRLILN